MASSNTSSNVIRFAGDVNVSKIIISSLITNKTFNVKNQLLTIQVFEDIFSPFITGNLIFRESADFASNFPFVGEEVVDIEIFTPSLNELNPDEGVIKGKFYIYKMADREELAERNTVYQLHFISMDAVKDLNVKISKGYSGKISDIANELLTGETTLYTKKKVNIEETFNKTKYVSNFWSPIRNINFILNNAQNASKSPTYMFYENRYGFNFVSLDTLNEQQSFQSFQQYDIKQIPNKNGGSDRDINLDYRKISDLNIPVSHDYVDKVTSGVYGSTLLYSDLASKQYFNQKFSMFENWGDDTYESRLNKYPISSKKVFSTYRATMYNDTIEVGLFSDYDDVSNARVRQKRISRLKQAEAHKIHITVPGRTDYTAGQVVTVIKYKAEPISKDKGDQREILDGIISGRYLVASINHVIDIEKHECHMTLIKDSMIIDLNKGSTTYE
jgi:hypothetical protein